MLWLSKGGDGISNLFCACLSILPHLIFSQLVDYEKHCTPFTPCDQAKNLTCEPQLKRCVCAPHPQPTTHVFIHDVGSGACIPVRKSALGGFWVCEERLQDLEWREGRAVVETFLGFCKSNHECSLSTPHSACNLASCECECIQGHQAAANIGGKLTDGRSSGGGSCELVKSTHTNSNRSCVTSEDCPFTTAQLECIDSQCSCFNGWFWVHGSCTDDSEAVDLSASPQRASAAGASTSTAATPVVNSGTNGTTSPSSEGKQEIAAGETSWPWHTVGPFIGLLALVAAGGGFIACLKARTSKVHKSCGRPLKMKVVEEKRLELRREQFTINTDRVLGRGKGGIVYHGLFNGEAVAVKTLNPNCRKVQMYLDSMCQEIEVFKILDEHPNIVAIHGYSPFLYGPGQIGYFILMEFCQLGSLLKYLKEGVFTSEPSERGVRYLNGHEEEYSRRELLLYSLQIASGQEYLASLNILHGDLASRNILMVHKHLVKISDFGLARRFTSEATVYIKTNNDPIPWKWSPPEVLQNYEFSLNSDIWSFGVTMWEIYSLGFEPYPGVNYSASFLKDLSAGEVRPGKPELASLEIYALMKKCWELDPRRRVSFAELKVKLQRMLEEARTLDAQEETLVEIDGYLRPQSSSTTSTLNRPFIYT